MERGLALERDCCLPVTESRCFGLAIHAIAKEQLLATPKLQQRPRNLQRLILLTEQREVQSSTRARTPLQPLAKTKKAVVIVGGGENLPGRQGHSGQRKSWPANPPHRESLKP